MLVCYVTFIMNSKIFNTARYSLCLTGFFMAWYGYEIGNKPKVNLFDSNSMPQIFIIQL